MIREWLRENLTRGMRKALRQLRMEWRQWMRHRRGLREARAYWDQTGLKLHFGCGWNYKEGWVNIDLDENGDLDLDLREFLPFDDDSASIIYSEHFLEHLEYPDEIEQLLAECRRVLEPGGVFSAVVPDSEWPIHSYVKGPKSEYFQLVRQKWHPKWFTTRMEHLNYHFSQKGEHKFVYDWETLEKVLRRAGFVEVRKRYFDPGLDGEDKRTGSLYVQARNPEPPPDETASPGGAIS